MVLLYMVKTKKVEQYAGFLYVDIKWPANDWLMRYVTFQVFLCGCLLKIRKSSEIRKIFEK